MPTDHAREQGCEGAGRYDEMSPTMAGCFRSARTVYEFANSPSPCYTCCRSVSVPVTGGLLGFPEASLLPLSALG
jgi:hypothetical protein